MRRALTISWLLLLALAPAGMAQSYNVTVPNIPAIDPNLPIGLAPPPVPAAGAVAPGRTAPPIAVTSAKGPFAVRRRTPVKVRPPQILPSGAGGHPRLIDLTH